MILQKTPLRAELRKKRAAFLALQKKAELRAAFTKHILSFLEGCAQDPCLVYAFWPLPQEPDITGALASLGERSYSIGLPTIVSLTSPLVFCSWTPDTPLVSSPHVPFLSLLEPGTSELTQAPSVVFVPCLGVDSQGTRLGYGKGCYDRTLTQLQRRNPQCSIVGVCFASGVVSHLPQEPHDVPLDAVITEEGLRLFPKNLSTT